MIVLEEVVLLNSELEFGRSHLINVPFWLIPLLGELRTKSEHKERESLFPPPPPAKLSNSLIFSKCYLWSHWKRAPGGSFWVNHFIPLFLFSLLYSFTRKKISWLNRFASTVHRLQGKSWMSQEIILNLCFWMRERYIQRTHHRSLLTESELSNSEDDWVPRSRDDMTRGVMGCKGPGAARNIPTSSPRQSFFVVSAISWPQELVQRQSPRVYWAVEHLTWMDKKLEKELSSLGSGLLWSVNYLVDPKLHSSHYTCITWGLPFLGHKVFISLHEKGCAGRQLGQPGQGVARCEWEVRGPDWLMSRQIIHVYHVRH